MVQKIDLNPGFAAAFEIAPPLCLLMLNGNGLSEPADVD